MARLVDDNAVQDFVDDNGVSCFVDDLGNTTCAGSTTAQRRLFPMLFGGSGAVATYTPQRRLFPMLFGTSGAAAVTYTPQRRLFPLLFGTSGGTVTPPVTAPSHRAQYSGIRPPKKRQKKKLKPPQLTPEIITAVVDATEERRDSAVAHVAVGIAGAVTAWEHVSDHAYAAFGLRMWASIDLTESSDGCVVFCSVVTDEEQALAVLRNAFDSLKQFFGE